MDYLSNNRIISANLDQLDICLLLHCIQVSILIFWHQLCNLLDLRTKPIDSGIVANRIGRCIINHHLRII